MNKIFDIEDGKVVISTDVLNIPWLKCIVEKYELPMAALNFVHYMTDPVSSYFNLGEDERSDKLLKDFPGDYKVTDLEINEAIAELIHLRVNSDPIIRLKVASQTLLNKVSRHCETVILSDGKEGNMADALRVLEKADKYAANFMGLSAKVEEKLKKGRGGINLSYDL